MSIGAWMLGVFGLFAFVSSALSLSSPTRRGPPLRRKISLVGHHLRLLPRQLYRRAAERHRAAVLERRAADGRAVPRLGRVHRHGGDLAAPLPHRRAPPATAWEGQARRPVLDGRSSWCCSRVFLGLLGVRRRAADLAATSRRCSGAAWSASGWWSRWCSISSGPRAGRSAGSPPCWSWSAASSSATSW